MLSAKETLDLLMSDDLSFYEQFILPLSDAKQQAFFQEFPDFLDSFGISLHEAHLLKDENVRCNLKKEREKHNDVQNRIQ